MLSVLKVLALLLIIKSVVCYDCAFVIETNNVEVTDVSGNVIYSWTGGFQHGYTQIPYTCGSSGYQICNSLAVVVDAYIYNENPHGVIEHVNALGVGACSSTFTLTASGATSIEIKYIETSVGSTFIKTDIASGVGDPHFTGLLKQSFDYQGKPNTYTNIYSDPFMSVNAYFQETQIHRNTLMSAIGILLASTTIELKEDGGNIAFYLNGQRSYEKEVDFSCFKINFNDKKVKFESQYHNVEVTDVLKKNLQFLNVAVGIRVNDSLGGVIGQTASENFNAVNLVPEEFIESTLLSTVATQNSFNAQDICKEPEYLAEKREAIIDHDSKSVVDFKIDLPM